MITVTITRNDNGHICGFSAANHSSSEVCAAVSMLVLNTANSIEALTDEPFTCDYNEDGGFLTLVLPEIQKGSLNKEVNLLLESMCLGLRSAQARYESEINIIEPIKGKVIEGK